MAVAHQKSWRKSPTAWTAPLDIAHQFMADLHARGICHGAITIDTVLLTAKGKSKLDLVHAKESTEAADLDQLRALFASLLRPSGFGGQALELPDLASAESAALLAAKLRG